MASYTGNVRPRNVAGPLPGNCSLTELEVYIERERIIYILDKTLHKIEVAVCLPLFLENDCELLQPLLTEKELSLIAECMPRLTRFSDQNKRKSQEQNISNHEAKKRLLEQRDRLMKGFDSFFELATGKGVGLGIISVSGSTRSKREDPDVSKVIHMLCSKPRTHLHHLIEGKSGELSHGCANFLKNLIQLRNLVDVRLSISPSAVRRRDEELRFAWRRNEKAKLDIIKLESKLDIQKKQGLTLLDGRDELIQKQLNKLSSQENNCKHNIKMIINASERQMVAECKQYEPKLQELSQEVKGFNIQHSALLQENLQSEKTLRARNLRIEGQLVAWLEKYDQDISEKQAEWDEIKAGYEVEIEEMLILQEEFDIQEEEHETLMAEKEAVYQHELEEKMFIFVCNRAARRIQRYWRAYRERKLARKKRHKGKRGKGSGKSK